MTFQNPLAMIVCAALGVAVGLATVNGLGGGVPGGPAQTALQPAAPDPNLAALLSEVRALGERLDRLAVQRPATASAREPVEATSSDAKTEADTAAVLERCVALLERLERRAALGTSAAAAPLEVPEVTPHELHAMRDRYVAADDADQDAYERELFLLSPQDVLDRFGRPDDIEVLERLVRWRWTWTEGDDTRTLTVSFANGYVCGASAY